MKTRTYHYRRAEELLDEAAMLDDDHLEYRAGVARQEALVHAVLAATPALGDDE
jgi:hypothetical protein